MQLIDSAAALDGAVQALRGSPILFIDTEFDSSKHGTRLCLLQLSNGEECFLVDPLRIPTLTPLGPVFAEAEEWVVHAGLQDLRLICDTVRVELPAKVFDTQLAWSLCSPEFSVSLAYLEYLLTGHRAPKGHQSDDWLRRPLTPSQLRYAAEDVLHLPALRTALMERLVPLQRLSYVPLASREPFDQSTLPPRDLSLQAFRNAWLLDAPQQAALRGVIAWHNGLSRSHRQFLPDAKTLLAVAQRVPTTVSDLETLKGLHRDFLKRHGKQLVASIQRFADGARDSFEPIEPAPYATFEEIRWDGWLSHARSEVCAALQVAPELALPSRLLKELRDELLSGTAPVAAITAIGEWRSELLAPVWNTFIERCPPPC